MIITNEKFIQILKSQNIYPTDAKEGTVLGSNEIYFAFGSVYDQGYWKFDNESGVATRDTAGFYAEDEKYTRVRRYIINEKNEVEIISDDEI